MSEPVYEHRVFPLPGVFNAGVPIGAAASQALATAIATQARDGFQFVGLYPYHVLQRPGCLGALLGAGATYAIVTMMVVRRPVG